MAADWLDCYIWIVLKLYGLIFKCDGIENWSDLLWQLLLGHSEKINPFNVVSVCVDCYYGSFIFFFLLFFRKDLGIYYFFNKYFCIWLQYTGINYDYFSRVSFEVRYPLGRLTEMIPYAGIGIILHMQIRI